MTVDATAPEIGPALLARRKARGLTLEQLAAASGISKSMLSEIERGQANPTFAVLWSITRALDLHIADLVQFADSGALASGELLTAAGTPEVRNNDGTCRMRILSPPRLADHIQWFSLDIEAGGALVSQAHQRGVWEHLTALTGPLRVRSGANTYAVEQNGTARYLADVDHAIFNDTPHLVNALLVTLYPSLTS